MERKLYRSDVNKVIAGVCGGLGEYFNIDPVIVRLAFVIVVFAGGAGILGYALAWIIIPRRPYESDLSSSSQSGNTGTTGSDIHTNMFSSSSSMTRYLPGLLLVIVGAVLLIRQTVFWFSWTEFLPVALIVIGAIVIFRSVQGRQSTSG